MQASIICFEMLIFAVVHRKVFSWRDFVLEEKDVESKPLTDALTDQIGDLKTIGESGSRLFTHQVCARPSSELLVAKDADQGTFGSGEGGDHGRRSGRRSCRRSRRWVSLLCCTHCAVFDSIRAWQQGRGYAQAWSVYWEYGHDQCASAGAGAGARAGTGAAAAAKAGCCAH